MIAAASPRTIGGAGTVEVSTPRSAFRDDIEGLRAVAVLLVLAYHAFPGVVRGGFVGVDVFFVISGFLITRLIVGHLQDDTFGFVAFYARRIKRLFPALALVLAATLATGGWSSFPDEYRQLGQHVAAAATFVSNIVLRREVGYFDHLAETKPLLHLWSLAIEEQFYLAWPLLLATVWRFGRARLVVALLAAVALASLAYGIAIVDVDPGLAFYSPLARGWELMLGAGLALARPLSLSRALPAQSVIGCALVVASAFGLDRAMTFPGALALLPTLGAVLLVAAGPHAVINRRVLAHPAMVAIGRVSYPLYLWHWPLLSFAFIAEEGHPSPTLRLGLLATSGVLAWATWRWVERPVRRSTSRAVPLALVALVATIGLGGYVVMRLDGLGARFGATASYLDYFDDARPATRYDLREHVPEVFAEDCDFYDNAGWRRTAPSVSPRPALASHCDHRPPGATRAVFLWGDSHAARLRVGLVEALPREVALLQVTTSGCIPSLADSAVTQPFCTHSNHVALATIARERPDVVVIAQRDDHRVEQLRAIAIELHRLGVARVLVLGPVPQWRPELYKTIASKYWERTPSRLADHLDLGIVELEARLRAQLRSDEPFEFVDLFDFLCTRDGCLTAVDGDRREGLVTYDYGHFTPRASSYVGKQLLGPLIAPTLR